MAQQGLIPDRFQLRSDSKGWALCIGAGISFPLFPSWYELVEDLTRDISKNKDGIEIGQSFREFAQQFSLDALIEAARDRLTQSHEQFAIHLGALLYSRIKNTFRSEWGLFARALSASSPSEVDVSDWCQFLGGIQEYSKSLTVQNGKILSALDLAAAVVDASEKANPPDAILSFNAEPLFYALINAEISKRSPTSSRKKRLDRITRLTSFWQSDRIPYFFCHGLLPFPGASERFKMDIDSGKLVFSESEYLALANTSFAWQSSTFINIALFRHIVFVGLSLTDPNIRRWLAWIHAVREKELARFGNHVSPSVHYWLVERKSSDWESHWMEASAAHLGVRLVWLPKWGEAGNTLRKGLSIF